MHTQHRYGAHEVIELHEVLNNAGDALNTLQLYAPYAADPELVQIVHHQMNFMQQEYNGMVHTVRGLGGGEGLPDRPGVQTQAKGTLMPPASPQPHANSAQMDDRDVASALLGMHKASAKLQMSAALEAAHPQIRDMLLQGAVNCTHQAYEVWGYMHRKGYYPFAVMPDAANAQLLRPYQPVASAAAGFAPPAMTEQGPGHQAAGANPTAAGSTASLTTGEQPFTPVNASYAYAPPASQEHYVESMENTSMTAEALQTEMVDYTGALSQQADGKRTRGRSKTT